MQPVHVINIDIQDNHEEATIGAFVICELAKLVRSGLRRKSPRVRLVNLLRSRVGSIENIHIGEMLVRRVQLVTTVLMFVVGYDVAHQANS